MEFMYLVFPRMPGDAVFMRRLSNTNELLLLADSSRVDFRFLGVGVGGGGLYVATGLPALLCGCSWKQLIGKSWDQIPSEPCGIFGTALLHPSVPEAFTVRTSTWLERWVGWPAGRDGGGLLSAKQAEALTVFGKGAQSGVFFSRTSTKGLTSISPPPPPPPPSDVCR